MQSAVPRPPRPPIRRGAHPNSGPAWVSAPPPLYHQGEAVSLDEFGGGPALEAALTKPVRCPRCATVFDWTTRRPAEVTCPSCGVTGTIR